MTVLIDPLPWHYAKCKVIIAVYVRFTVTGITIPLFLTTL